jgi:outer membrane lipoprotein carrier protein
MRLSALALLAALLPAPAPADPPQPIPPNVHGGEKVTALLERVAEAQANAKTIQADFEQDRESHLLAAPSHSRGRFYFRAPDEVRWQYEAPREMTVVIKDGTALTYRPAEKRAERIEVGHVQRRVLRLLGAAEPLETLKRYFSLTFLDPGDDHNYVLTLDPLTHQLKKRFREVRVEIDRTRFLPVAVSYTEADGDRTAYTFSQIVLNQPLPADLFNLALPPDVSVVEVKLHGGSD